MSEVARPSAVVDRAWLSQLGFLSTFVNHRLTYAILSSVASPGALFKPYLQGYQTERAQHHPLYHVTRSFYRSLY